MTENDVGNEMEKRDMGNTGELMKIISERSSVRNYNSKKPVEDWKLRVILEAARLAPSSNNTQPWHYIIIKDKKMRDKLATAAPMGAASNKWLRHAPVLIVCCGRKNLLYHSAPGRLLDMDYFRMDVAISVEHIVLAARGLGLGTCWIGWFDERRVKRLLHVPSDYRVTLLLPVGYPKGKWPPQKEKKELNEFVYGERFGRSIDLPEMPE